MFLQRILLGAQVQINGVKRLGSPWTCLRSNRIYFEVFVSRSIFPSCCRCCCCDRRNKAFCPSTCRRAFRPSCRQCCRWWPSPWLWRCSSGETTQSELFGVVWLFSGDGKRWRTDRGSFGVSTLLGPFLVLVVTVLVPAIVPLLLWHAFWTHARSTVYEVLQRFLIARTRLRSKFCSPKRFRFRRRFGSGEEREKVTPRNSFPCLVLACFGSRVLLMLTSFARVLFVRVAFVCFFRLREGDGPKLAKRDAPLVPGDRLKGGQYVSFCTSIIATGCKPKYFEVRHAARVYVVLFTQFAMGCFSGKAMYGITCLRGHSLEPPPPPTHIRWQRCAGLEGLVFGSVV